MVQCRCAVLNHLHGAIAADYARTHLERADGNGHGRGWTCPDTGVRWADESPQTGIAGVSRLRRQER